MFLLCWEGDSATRVWWSLGNRNRRFNGRSNSCRILQFVHHSEGMDKSIFVPVFLYFLFILSVWFASLLASSVLQFAHDGFTAKLVNAKHDQTTHRQQHRTHTNRWHTATYPKKTNDEAGSWKVVNALRTKDDRWRWSWNRDRNM
jgi:hypothetical protein